MRDAASLWSSRVREYWTLAVKYLRLIANSGFVFTLYLLFLFGSIYYGEFLEWLPEAFPAVLFFTLLFTLLLTRGRVRTFLKEADLVFLLPMESRMKSYFRASFRYSWMMETFWLFLAMFVLLPLFLDRIAGDFGTFMLVLGSLSLLKLWNLAAGFQEMRLPDDRQVTLHKAGRLLLNGAAAWAVFSQSLVLSAAAAAVFAAAWFAWFRPIRYPLAWGRLIAVEMNTVRMFFRIANNFTDVPHLKQHVKRRNWLQFVLRRPPFRPGSVYRYLFGRAFLRAGDYLGIYARLTFIGILFVTAVEPWWGSAVAAALFAFMTLLQLETLHRHFDTMDMVSLYPVPPEGKDAGMQYWMLRAGIVQTLFFLAAALPSWENMTAAAAGAGIIYLYGIQKRLPEVMKRNKKS
ncbi:ABC transporter permease [Alkalicoccus chagannorensis]|uniref:ABC transporter permease n=1 Tax=Alkalicoccus chagannorensis TaxID=427072 RepID=UPI0004171D05|nr:ABC transporter permease [Alkalicoccus chagannorensis]